MAKVEAKHVFKFIVKPTNWCLEKSVYTNIDFSEKYNKGIFKDAEEWRKHALINADVENMYFTEEVHENIRRIFADMILHGDIHLNIQCTEWGNCCEVEESELLENIVKIK